VKGSRDLDRRTMQEAAIAATSADAISRSKTSRVSYGLCAESARERAAREHPARRRPPGEPLALEAILAPLSIASSG